MRCASAGSSQLPKASTRSGTPPTTSSVVSPMISGRSLAAGPFHQHLRLRQQQRLEPVDLGAQRHRLVARQALVCDGLAARAQQHEGGEHGERQQADDQREAGDVLAAQSGGGAAERIGNARAPARRRGRA